MNMRLIAIRMARPEESLQAIALPSRHDVHVQMRHALAHLVVDGDESSLRLQRFLNRARQLSRVGEQWLHEAIVEIEQGIRMQLGHEQAMSGEQRPVIQESDGMLILENVVRRQFAIDNPAKRTVRFHSWLSCDFQWFSAHFAPALRLNTISFS